MFGISGLATMLANDVADKSRHNAPCLVPVAGYSIFGVLCFDTFILPQRHNPAPGPTSVDLKHKA